LHSLATATARRITTLPFSTAPERSHIKSRPPHYQLFIRLYNNTRAHLQTRLRSLKERQTELGVASQNTTSPHAHQISDLSRQIIHNGSRARTSRGQEPYAGRRARAQSYVKFFDAPTYARPLTNHARVTDEILVERRCLGQTELKVKPGQVGTSNATKPDNLGVLDYAHLRVPLPSDLSSSGIFTKGSNRKYPEAYFLMVRARA
jgi:hypothetical protein